MYVSSDSFIPAFPLNLAEAIAGMTYTTRLVVVFLVYKDL